MIVGRSNLTTVALRRLVHEEGSDWSAPFTAASKGDDVESDGISFSSSEVITLLSGCVWLSAFTSLSGGPPSPAFSVGAEGKPKRVKKGNGSCFYILNCLG